MSQVMYSKEVLLEDKDIVILGYPTQSIITMIKNNPKNYNAKTLIEGITFKVESNQYKNYSFIFELHNNIDAEYLCKSINKSKNIYLSNNIFFQEDNLIFGNDFLEEELNIKNNILLNNMLDRKISFTEIKIPNNKLISKNIDKNDTNNLLKINKNKVQINIETIDLIKSNNTKNEDLLYSNKANNDKVCFDVSNSKLDYSNKAKIDFSKNYFSGLDSKNNYDYDNLMNNNSYKKISSSFIADKNIYNEFSTLYTNIDNTIIPTSHEIALKNMLYNNRIGVYSSLWSETIEDKIKCIIKNKFSIIYYKLFILSLSEDNLNLLSMIKDEVTNKKKENIDLLNEEIKKFLLNFTSPKDYYSSLNNFNSDFDIIVEANRKSPIILIHGKPFIGKTEICKSLCKKLNLVYVSPEDFVLNKLPIKIAKYNEAIENIADEPQDENQELNEDNNNESNDKKNKKEKKLPDIRDYLTDIEYKVYYDLYLNTGELSLNTLKDLYNYLIFKSDGYSKGVVIEHCYYNFSSTLDQSIIENKLNISDNYINTNENDNISNIKELQKDNLNSVKETEDNFNIENNKKTFAELLTKGFFGNIEIDYIVELNSNYTENIKVARNLKYYLKTNDIKSKRDIELYSNPLKADKIKSYPDEVNEEDDINNNNDDEELNIDDELKPLKEDLIDILNFKDILHKFEDQYKNDKEIYINYFNKKTISNYQKDIANYSYKHLNNNTYNKVKCNYIELDISGIEVSTVCNLLCEKFYFTKHPRYIAKALDPNSYKNLLIDNKEGILPYRRWSFWKDIDPVSLKDKFTILHGSTEHAVEYVGRVFLFVNEDNKNLFLSNPKIYLKEKPKVPIEYKIAIIGPPKSGKKTIANIINELFDLTVVNIDQITNDVLEWQKKLEEPIPNNTCYSKVHFSKEEFIDITIKKKPIDFYSKIIFMLDYIGIPLNKKMSKNEEMEIRVNFKEKLNHILNPPSRKRLKKKYELEPEEIDNNELSNKGNNNLNKDDNEDIDNNNNNNNHNNKENEKIEDVNDYSSDLEAIMNNNNKQNEDIEEYETDTQYIDPYPSEDEFIIPEIKSSQFYYAYDEDYNYPKVKGIVSINYPQTIEEINKFKEFNIKFDKIIYLEDQSEEPLKAYMSRIKPDFYKYDEEKQAAEILKTQESLSKYDDILTLLRDNYNVNEEDCVIKVNIADNIPTIKNLLNSALNPFILTIDDEEKYYNNNDFGPEKISMPFGIYGKYCPVTFTNENWLIQGNNDEELTVNHKRYLFASKIEKEEFQNNVSKYLVDHNNTDKEKLINSKLLNSEIIDVPSPKIMIIGPKGSGVNSIIKYLSNLYKFSITDLKSSFMNLYNKNFNERKQIRIDRKREELIKEREERIKEKQQNNENENENEEEPEPDIDEILANDNALDEEDENFNNFENSKEIFKGLFDANKPSLYNACWFEMNDKVGGSFSDILFETKRTPDCLVFIKTSLDNVIKRNFKENEIKDKYNKLYKESKLRKEEAYKKLKEEKLQEYKERIKEEFNNIEEPNEEEREKYEQDMNKVEDISKEEAIKFIEDELITEDEKDNIFNSQDELLPDLENMINDEKKIYIDNYEEQSKFVFDELMESVKARIPVLEIDNNKPFELTIKAINYKLELYIKYRDNLIERQLCNYIGENNIDKNNVINIDQLDENFVNPKLTLKNILELNNSEVLCTSSYNNLSCLNTHKLVNLNNEYGKDYIKNINSIKYNHVSNYCFNNFPVVYRDKIYYFNNIDDRNTFLKNPLNYTKLSGIKHELLYNNIYNTINSKVNRLMVFIIGETQTGKSTIAETLENYGYYVIRLEHVIDDLLKLLDNKYNNKLKCDIENKLYKGEVINDDIIIDSISKRMNLPDLVNRNIVLDGIPYTQSQIKYLEINNINPDLVINIESQKEEIILRCNKRKDIYGYKEIIIEDINTNKMHYKSILDYYFYTKQYSIININTNKSKWYNESIVIDYIEQKRYQIIDFNIKYNKDLPCMVGNLLSPYLKELLIKNLPDFSFYSPVSLRTSNYFNYNKYLDNFITFCINKFYYLSNFNEFEQFSKNTNIYYDYLELIKYDIIPPKHLSYEEIADEFDDNNNIDINYNDENIEKLEKDECKKNLQYQGCCPVEYSNSKKLVEGNLIHCSLYKGKLYSLSSYLNLKTFLTNPEKYSKLFLPVKTIHDLKPNEDKRVDFNNTINYLETNFGSLITKGMLELSRNRIKYPYIDTKESSIKYLALFLKANNPRNSKYSKQKYSNKLKTYLENAQLPYDLLNVYECYKKEEGYLKKELLLRELKKLANNYDELMEIAKNQKNTKFDGFFNDNY